VVFTKKKKTTLFWRVPSYGARVAPERLVLMKTLVESLSSPLFTCTAPSFLSDGGSLVLAKRRHVDDGVIGEIEVYDIEHDMLRGRHHLPKSDGE
jgi:hypothetical protein